MTSRSELVNLRLIATGHRAHRLEVAGVRATAAAAGIAASRMVAFARGAAPVLTAVTTRGAVTGNARPGPLIVESYDSTVVVPPGSALRADDHGNLLIDVQAEVEG